MNLPVSATRRRWCSPRRARRARVPARPMKQRRSRFACRCRRHGRRGRCRSHRASGQRARAVRRRRRPGRCATPARRPDAGHRGRCTGPCRRRGGAVAQHRWRAVAVRGGLPGLRRHAQRPEEVVKKAFGETYASLVTLTRNWCRSSVPRAKPNRTTVTTGRARPADRARAQDAAGVFARLASRVAAPGVAAADAALVCGAQAAVPGDDRHRVAAGLRTAGQPVGHPADQVELGGPVLSLPAAGRVPAHGAAGRRDTR